MADEHHTDNEPARQSTPEAVAVEFETGLATESRAEAVANIARALGAGWKLTDETFEGYDGLVATPETTPDRNDPGIWTEAGAVSRVAGVRTAVPLFAVVQPDLAATYREDDPAPEAFGVADSDAQPAPADVTDWHLKMLRVTDRAEVGTGRGVRIAVIDTGFTDHPETRDALDRDDNGRVIGRDFYGGGNGEPKDPVQGRFPFAVPSHGTMVASVAASKPGTQMQPAPAIPGVEGVAPDARVRHYRVSNHVALTVPTHLIPALIQATDDGADVINISLGLPYYWPALHRAIRYAVERGVIVVCASGNVVPYVVWPGALPEVLATAGVGPDGLPWKGSSPGAAVDVSAPGSRVWKASATRKNDASPVDFLCTPGSGTTFAAACCSGLAALWLERHGGRRNVIAHYNGDARRVAQAYHFLTRKTARPFPASVRANRYGVGVPDARALLAEPLPAAFALQAEGTFRAGLLGVGEDDPLVEALSLTLGADFGGERPVGLRADAAADAAADVAADDGEGMSPGSAAAVLSALLGGARSGDELLIRELWHHVTADRSLYARLRDVARGTDIATLRDALRDSRPLSPALEARLDAATPPDLPPPDPTVAAPPAPPSRFRPTLYDNPPHRRLRVFAFDPSIGTTMTTAEHREVTASVPWENDLGPGPVGEYLEVVDVDPATGAAYQPVDLNQPFLLAADGLTPSEGDPMFHQQMVYAVAMTTIHHFENALGRPVFWKTRPHVKGSDEGFEEKLRIYPHALRARNAYYSPEKRALLFGYFRAVQGPTNEPGPMVFTCLSYDIIAHETTHAILDGIYNRYIEPTNPDVLAFHEAFADVVALFQHFTYPGIVLGQIERTGGNLEAESLFGKLAIQFGQATGRRGALRNAIGSDVNGTWVRTTPDPALLSSPEYQKLPHLRGSVLVSAVFDAFLMIYNRRIRPHVRLATGGSDQLPTGRVPHDLAEALAGEAAKTARHVLNLCIRALDYLPPLDLTFGEYLRAILTADRDLVPDDPYGYRVAFADAFRRWGIVPRDVASVSVDSLCWNPPEGTLADVSLSAFMEGDRIGPLTQSLSRWQTRRARRASSPANEKETAKPTRKSRKKNASDAPPGTREHLHDETRSIKGAINRILRNAQTGGKHPEIVALSQTIGIDFNASFEVHTLRVTSRQGPNGEVLPLAVVTLTQPVGTVWDGRVIREVRVGATLLFHLADGTLHYAIYRRNATRQIESVRQNLRLRLSDDGADPYGVLDPPGEPFAALHLTGRA